MRNSIRRLLGRKDSREFQGDPCGVKRVICYRGGEKWSLSFVWRSLESAKAFACSPHIVNACSCDSLAELRQLFCTSDAFVVVLSHVHLPVVLKAGFPPSRIIYYFAHICMDKKLPKLKKLHAVLAQNMFEHNLALMRGVETERVHFFPAGVDRRLFFATVCSLASRILRIFVVPAGPQCRKGSSDQCGLCGGFFCKAQPGCFVPH